MASRLHSGTRTQRSIGPYNSRTILRTKALKVACILPLLEESPSPLFHVFNVYPIIVPTCIFRNAPRLYYSLLLILIYNVGIFRLILVAFNQSEATSSPFKYSLSLIWGCMIASALTLSTTLGLKLRKVIFTRVIPFEPRQITFKHLAHCH
jgi:hypothetical protein